MGANLGKAIGEPELVQVLSRLLLDAAIEKHEFGLLASFKIDGEKIRLDICDDGTGFVSLGTCWAIPPDMLLGEVLPRINRLNR